MSTNNNYNIDINDLYEQTNAGLDVFAAYYPDAAKCEHRKNHFFSTHEEKTPSTSCSLYNGKWYIKNFADSEKGMDAIEFSKKMEDSGAGELLVTSMDRDGTQVGYDIELMSKISSKVNIPVIASGGVGNLDHLVDGIKLGKASAVLAASIFHYGKHSVKEAKEYLDLKGIPVRI